MKTVQDHAINLQALLTDQKPVESGVPAECESKTDGLDNAEEPVEAVVDETTQTHPETVADAVADAVAETVADAVAETVADPVGVTSDALEGATEDAVEDKTCEDAKDTPKDTVDLGETGNKITNEPGNGTV
eukprot:Selendium_serpulae@DN6172_c0_g1_i1.p1